MCEYNVAKILNFKKYSFNNKYISDVFPLKILNARRIIYHFAWKFVFIISLLPFTV